MIKLKHPVIKKIISELGPHKKDLAIVMVMIAAVSVSMLSLGHTIKLFIDHGIKTNNVEALDKTLIYLVAAIIVLVIGSFFRSFYINTISDAVVSSVRLKTYKALLHHQVKYFDTIRVSDIIGRLTHDISSIGDIITNIISFSFRNLVLVVGGMTMMFIQNIKLSMIVMTSVPISFFLIKKLSKKVRAMARDLNSRKATVDGIIGETLSNIRIVYAFGIQDYRINKLTELGAESGAIARRYRKIRAMFFAIAFSVVSVLMLIVLWIGGIDVIEGTLSSGNMVSFIFYAISTASAIGGIAEVIGEMQKSIAAAERVFELQEFDEDIDRRGHKSLDFYQDKSFPEAGEIPSHPMHGYVMSPDIDNIYFHATKFFYPSRPELQILQDITIDAKKGDFIGLAGPSGSGKSTILQIIMGLYVAEDSIVKINGELVDLSKMPSFLSKISYVPQDPFLFSASIRENITLGREHGNLEEVMKITGLDEVIALLPKGLDTYVGEKGMQLSGGQKQRLAIARSIYVKPDILLLDEATSALDLHSEDHITTHLRKFMSDKIIIAVAHRLSSIKNASKILLIHDGIVVDTGDHHGLIKSSLLYQHLTKFQNV